MLRPPPVYLLRLRSNSCSLLLWLKSSRISDSCSCDGSCLPLGALANGGLDAPLERGLVLPRDALESLKASRDVRASERAIELLKFLADRHHHGERKMGVLVWQLPIPCVDSVPPVLVSAHRPSTFASFFFHGASWPSRANCRASSEYDSAMR